MKRGKRGRPKGTKRVVRLPNCGCSGKKLMRMVDGKTFLCAHGYRWRPVKALLWEMVE